MIAVPSVKLSLLDLYELVQRWRRRDESVAFTSGCFDVLHEGHVHLLGQARGVARRLIVAVNSDDYCRRTKGVQRPIQGAAIRARVVAGIAQADAVVEFDQVTPERLLEVIRPDVYVLGSDYRGKEIPGARNCGRIEFVERLADFSTTNCVERLRCCANRPVVSL